jgi:hypothetical protein
VVQKLQNLNILLKNILSEIFVKNEEQNFLNGDNIFCNQNFLIKIWEGGEELKAIRKIFKS